MSNPVEESYLPGGNNTDAPEEGRKDTVRRNKPASYLPLRARLL